MGIANRTPDSFFDKGSYFAFDRFLDHCDRLVADGADLLDVGGVKAGAGEEVSEAEEMDRVIPAIEAVSGRLDVPVSVDTWRASVAKAAYEAGAVVGNDISGFSDPRYLTEAARAGAAVVATHIRLGPRIPDLDPPYDDVVAAVEERLAGLARSAEAAGIPPSRIVIDAGLDLGKTTAHSLELLGASRTARRARLPPPAVGLQQDLHRRDARPRRGRAPGRLARRRRPRHNRRVPHPARARRSRYRSVRDAIAAILLEQAPGQ